MCGAEAKDIRRTRTQGKRRCRPHGAPRTRSPLVCARTRAYSASTPDRLRTRERNARPPGLRTALSLRACGERAARLLRVQRVRVVGEGDVGDALARGPRLATLRARPNPDTASNAAK